MVWESLSWHPVSAWSQEQSQWLGLAAEPRQQPQCGEWISSWHEPVAQPMPPSPRLASLVTVTVGGCAPHRAPGEGTGGPGSAEDGN